MKQSEQKLRDALLVSAELLIEHGLNDWKIKLNGKRRVLAETNHTRKTILYSKHFVMVADKEQFIGVTIHEIAHALLGKRSGHGREFMELCKKLSPGSDYAANRKLEVNMYRYVLTCPGCGAQIKLLGKKRNGVCRKCLEERNEENHFEVKENKLEVRLW